MGSEKPDISDAFLVALTRISGILLGVFLSLLLSVVIFPRSASHQVQPWSAPVHVMSCCKLRQRQKSAHSQLGEAVKWLCRDLQRAQSLIMRE